MSGPAPALPLLALPALPARPQLRPKLVRDGVNPAYYRLTPDSLEDRQALALVGYTDVWDTLTSRDHAEDAFVQLKRWANGAAQITDSMVPIYVFFLNALQRDAGMDAPLVEVRVAQRSDGCVYSLVEPGSAHGADLYAANAAQQADEARRAAPGRLPARAWTFLQRLRAQVLQVGAEVGENLLGWNRAFREQFNAVVVAIERALWTLFRPYRTLAPKVRVPLWYGEVEFASLDTVDYDLLSKKYRSTTTNPQVTFPFARSRDKGHTDNCCWGILVTHTDCLAIDVSEALPYKGLRCYDEAEVILAPGTVYTEVARIEPGTNFEIREVNSMLTALRADMAAVEQYYPMFQRAYNELLYRSRQPLQSRRAAAVATHTVTRHNFEPEAVALLLASPPTEGYRWP